MGRSRITIGLVTIHDRPPKGGGGRSRINPDRDREWIANDRESFERADECVGTVGTLERQGWEAPADSHLTNPGIRPAAPREAPPGAPRARVEAPNIVEPARTYTRRAAANRRRGPNPDPPNRRDEHRPSLRRRT